MQETSQEHVPAARIEQIRQDLLFLAGKLLHRSAFKEGERTAADYIRSRFSAYTQDVNTERFYAIDNHLYLFASYYTEFLVVTLLAYWWPLAAFLYGVAVFSCYFAEFLGFSVFGRLLPQYESQNVVARMRGERPRHILVVTANYDSGSANLLSRPGLLRWLRMLHLLVVAAMAMVLLGALMDAWAEHQVGGAHPLGATLRWSGVAVLVPAALALFYASTRREDIRGANGNASGVAALLNLAQRLHERPVAGVDVLLAATGANESWMSGMRHLLHSLQSSKRQVHVLNLEGVGAGRLHYLKIEGMLHPMKGAPELLRAARSAARAHDVQPGRLRAFPTAAHAALARGFSAMSIVGLDEDGLLPYWNAPEDKLPVVKERQIEEAAAFAEALLRRLAD